MNSIFTNKSTFIDRNISSDPVTTLELSDGQVDKMIATAVRDMRTLLSTDIDSLKLDEKNKEKLRELRNKIQASCVGSILSEEFKGKANQ